MKGAETLKTKCFGKSGRIMSAALVAALSAAIIFPVQALAAAADPAPAAGGTYYSVLMDISGSVPDEAFISARGGVRDLAHNTTPADAVSIITFGDEVHEVAAFQGGDPAEADANIAVLDNILPDNQTTKLYDAVSFMEQLSDAAPQPTKRAVIVSDGCDVSELSADTIRQMINDFSTKNIKVYGLYIDTTDSTEETTEMFRSFCERSGGTVIDVNGYDTQTAMQAVIADMTAANVEQQERERAEEAAAEAGEEAPPAPVVEETVEEAVPEEPPAVDLIATEESAEPAEEKPAPSNDFFSMIAEYFPIILGIAAAILIIVVAIVIIKKKNDDAPLVDGRRVSRRKIETMSTTVGTGRSATGAAKVVAEKEAAEAEAAAASTSSAASSAASATGSAAAGAGAATASAATAAGAVVSGSAPVPEAPSDGKKPKREKREKHKDKVEFFFSDK